MTFTVDLDVVLTVLSIVTILVVWVQSSKARATMEGRHQKELEAMKERIQYIEGELSGVKECNQTLDGAVIQIRTDVAWIKAAVSEIKDSLATLGRRDPDI
jgi:predicted nuclease with TOPRIM domain